MPVTRRRPTLAAATAVTIAVAVAGCGGKDFKNDPRPPASVPLSASVSAKTVSVSPVRVGAGPISLIVTNQTTAVQDVTLRRTSGPPGGSPTQSTGPINPDDTATLRANLATGRYTLSTGTHGIAPATIDVGRARTSAQNLLLQP